MNDQRKFLLILSLMVLLCIGTGLAVLTMLPHGEQNDDLREQLERAVVTQQAMIQQLDALKARVRDLDALNQRLAAEAAGARRASGAAPKPDPMAVEPPAPGEPLRHDPGGAATAEDQAGALLSNLLNLIGGTNAVSSTVVTGAPSRAMVDFVLQADRLQSRQESSARATELASRLGLTEAQREAVEKVLLRKRQGRAALLEQMLSAPDGALDGSLAADVAEEESSSWFTGILSPEQAAEHDKWQEAERRSRAEAGALQSLAILTEALPDLSQEQKDQLYQHHLAKAGGPSGLAPAFLGFAAGGPRSEDPALAEILTPAQLEAWKKRAPVGPVLPAGIAPGTAVRAFEIKVGAPSPP